METLNMKTKLPNPDARQPLLAAVITFEPHVGQKPKFSPVPDFNVHDSSELLLQLRT